MAILDPILQAARSYADLGYPVFPCQARGKAPLTAHGFHDASIDPEILETWWRQYPAANVAMATQGLLVVDADGADNPWPGDPERELELAAAPLARTPGGGRHWVFRQPPGATFRSTTGRLAPKVDTRADGGYLLLPPSVGANGRPYAWVPGLELEVPREGLPLPPQWLLEDLERLQEKVPLADSQVPSLDLDGNPIPDGQRNATLARLAGCMRRVGLSGDELAAALHRINRGRCRPPLPDTEVDTIAGSIGRYTPDQVATALAENHFAQVFQASLSEPDACPDGPDPGPTPPELLRVPGFVGAVVDYTLRSAPYPEPALAFAGALALQAYLAGRKVRDAADNRTNLYLLALANSGAGKDFPRKVNQKILHAVDLADGLGDTFASGEGLEDRLAATPNMLFQTDEIDVLMSKIATGNDVRHEGIMQALLKLNTSANALYPMRVKVGREGGFIDQPSLCLFGTAIPTNFYEALSPKMLSNGFLARTVILETGRRGRGQRCTASDPPPELIEVARWWADDHTARGNLGACYPVPRLVPTSPEAEDVLGSLRDRADDAYTAAEGRGDNAAMALWARAHEKARRLALVYACSEDHRQPTITSEAARWACAFVEHQTWRMLHMAAAHVSQGEFDTRCKHLLATLASWRERHGDAWMPFWRISRRHPWSERDHIDVRTMLLHQNRIEYSEVSTTGRPSRLYRLLTTG